MGMVNLHPDAAELGQFALGTLSDALQTVVELHLAECPECQARVEATCDDEVVALLRSAHVRTRLRTSGSPDTISPIQTPAFISKDSLAGEIPGEERNPLAGSIPEGLANHPRYRVRRLVGRGGMGAVFEAEHRLMNRSVALKIINPTFTASAAAVERFRREVRAAAQLSHANIVTAFDAEEIDGTHFLVMEYVEGVSLARLVQERGPLPVPEACDFIRQAALALQHAHEQGMVHRDVKPDNLLRCVDGRIKVVDFGLASLATEYEGGLTDERTVMGTPEFMAPEQAEDARRADVRSDIYSLGCTLFYLLTGRAPYPASTSMLKLVAHREQPIPKIDQFRADVPSGLARVLERLLAKRPEDRYSAPGEVSEALAPFTKPQAIKSRRRRGLLVALAAVLLLGGAAVGAVVYRFQTDRGELVITTDSDDVEVIIKSGGKVIEIIDTKSKKQITLHSGTYELELKGAEGLKLDIDKATLTRGGTVVATIERLAKPVVAQDSTARPLVGLGKLELVWKNTDWAPAGYIHMLNFSPDGTRLVVARHQMPGGLRVYNVATGEVELTAGGSIPSFAPDGKTIWATGLTNLLQIDAKTGKLLQEFPKHPAQIWNMRLSPDGTRAWTATSIGTLHLWDLEAKKQLKQWDVVDFEGFWFTADENLLFSGRTRRNPSGFWNLKRDDFRPALTDAIGIFEKSFLPGGKQIVTNKGHKLQVIDLASDKVVREIDLGEGLGNNGRGGVVSSSGRYYADGTSDGSWLGVWDIQSGEMLGGIQTTLSPMHQRYAISPDGRYAAAGDNRGGVYVFHVPAAGQKAKP